MLDTADIVERMFNPEMRKRSFLDDGCYEPDDLPKCLQEVTTPSAIVACIMYSMYCPYWCAPPNIHFATSVNSLTTGKPLVLCGIRYGSRTRRPLDYKYNVVVPTDMFGWRGLTCGCESSIMAALADKTWFDGTEINSIMQYSIVFAQE